MNAAFEQQAGRNVRALRISHALTQDQLSAKMQLHGCDITRSALAKIEVGQRHIYLDELACLATIFGVAAEEIYQPGNF